MRSSRRSVSRSALHALWAVIFACIPPHSAQARPSQQVPVGVRALGMGGAYSSISDDASALFWNPAGLPWVGHQEFGATHADLFGSGIKDNLASIVLPLSPNSAVGADWYHSGFDDTELTFGESRIDLAYGRRLGSMLALGGTVKYLGRNTELDGSSVRRGHGYGVDLGLIARPMSRVRVGVVGQDLFDTNVSYSDGMGTTPAIPMNFRAGVSYSPTRGTIVTCDADDRWHVGAEGRLLDMVAVRAGLQNDWHATDAVTWSVGAGVKAGIFRFDYALVDHPVLGSTSHFGLAMEFNFNPAQVRIEKVEPKDLFASFHKIYAREPVAVVRVRNLDDRPIETKLRVLIPGVMRDATEQTVVLRPNAAEAVPLTAVIPDDAAQSTGNRSIQVQVTATYQSSRLPRTEKASAKGILYAPGAIDWSQGVDQAAAYVTMSDPSVDAFAREATRLGALARSEPDIERNIAFAASIVDALASIGFTYVPDPANPYSAISETPRAVDTIAYPRDSLRRRTGDCDDSSVLLAALLGNVGISTRFIDVPGHIFLMMDTGVHERNRAALGLEESRTVVLDERVWIPLETTSVGKGFAEAWDDGADSYAAWFSRGNAAVVDIDAALARYEASDPPGAAVATNLDPSALDGRLSADLATIDGWRAGHVDAVLSRGAGLDRHASTRADAEVAHVYYTAGDWDRAKRYLEAALNTTPDSAAILNNIGNVLAASGDLETAESNYERALRSSGSASDPGTWLNLGLVRYTMGDTAGAERPLVEGMTRCGGLERACALLAFTESSDDAREGSRKMTEQETVALLKRAMIKVPPSAGKRGDLDTSISRDRRPAKRWTSRVAAGRSSDRTALLDHLYWKDL